MGLYVKQFIPVTFKMIKTGTSWAVLNSIYESAIIFFAVELFILQKFNPVFFERIVEVLEWWCKNDT